MHNVYCVGTNSQFSTVDRALRQAYRDIPQGETITIFLENQLHLLDGALLSNNWSYKFVGASERASNRLDDLNSELATLDFSPNNIDLGYVWDGDGVTRNITFEGINLPTPTITVDYGWGVTFRNCSLDITNFTLTDSSSPNEGGGTGQSLEIDGCTIKQAGVGLIQLTNTGGLETEDQYKRRVLINNTIGYLPVFVLAAAGTIDFTGACDMQTDLCDVMVTTLFNTTNANCVVNFGSDTDDNGSHTGLTLELSRTDFMGGDDYYVFAGDQDLTINGSLYMRIPAGPAWFVGNDYTGDGKLRFLSYNVVPDDEATNMPTGSTRYDGTVNTPRTWDGNNWKFDYQDLPLYTITPSENNTFEIDLNNTPIQLVTCSAATDIIPSLASDVASISKAVTVRIENTSGALRDFDWTNDPGWLWIGDRPTDIADAAIGILTITTFGGDNDEIVLSYQVAATA